MMKRHRILCGILGGFLFVALAAAGCGKKTNPIPPKLALHPAIVDLSVNAVPGGIMLRWSAPGPKGRVSHFRIFRSEETADRACPGCPQDYRPLATLKLADQTLRSEEGTEFRYIDTAVTEGRIYSYRISACDSRGHCGEPSAATQRLHEKR